MVPVSFSSQFRFNEHRKRERPVLVVRVVSIAQAEQEFELAKIRD